MPLSEIYIKLVVGFPRDPKVRALVRYGTDAGLARDLYVQMVLHCKENLTDGLYRPRRSACSSTRWTLITETNLLSNLLPLGLSRR